MLLSLESDREAKRLAGLVGPGAPWAASVKVLMLEKRVFLRAMVPVMLLAGCEGLSNSSMGVWEMVLKVWVPMPWLLKERKMGRSTRPAAVLGKTMSAGMFCLAYGERDDSEAGWLRV